MSQFVFSFIVLCAIFSGLLHEDIAQYWNLFSEYVIRKKVLSKTIIVLSISSVFAIIYDVWRGGMTLMGLLMVLAICISAGVFMVIAIIVLGKILNSNECKGDPDPNRKFSLHNTIMALRSFIF